MAKQTITAHLHMALEYAKNEDGTRNYYAPKLWQPELYGFRMSDTDDRVYVGAQQVEIDVPDDFNAIPAQVAALEAKKAAALAEYQRTVAELNERLSKLLAITHEAA